MKTINSKTKSFTLIELLVVISIIGLLSSIVLVNTRGSRNKAKIAKGLETSQAIHNSLGSEAVGVWDFDNYTAQDSSGNGNNGTIFGAVFSSDTPYSMVGQGSGKNSLSFDGSIGDYIQISAVAVLTTGTSFMLSVWVKPETTGTYRTIMGYNSTHRLLIVSTGQMLSQQDGNFFSGAAGDVPNGVWTHVIYWNNGTTERWYINGKQSGSDHITPNAEWDSAFKIGQYDLVNYPYRGLIDEVRIYSQAFSQSQIQKQYVEGLRVHSNLVLLDK